MRQVLEDHVAAIDSCDACELSAHGPFARFLRGAARSASFSEYFAGVEPGSLHRGIRCEDLHRLTYCDARFDLVTQPECSSTSPTPRARFASCIARCAREA
jgi:hypothetical protein